MILQANHKRKNLHGFVYGIASAAFFAFLFILSFSRSMTRGISHDEYQFIASGELLAGRGLLPYVDYPFLHMPYIAFANAVPAMFSSYHMLAVRTFNSICGILSALAIFYVAMLLLQDAPAPFKIASGLLAALLFVADPSYILIEGFAWNHALPTLLSLMAFIFYYRGGRTGRLARMNFFSGLMVGLAMGVRLSYAVLIPVFACAVFIYPFDQGIRSRLRNAAIYGSGLFVGLFPALILYLMAPGPFFYGNYVYPHWNPIYREILLHPEVMTVLQKAKFFRQLVHRSPIDLLLYWAGVIYLPLALVQLLRFKDRFHFEAVFAAGLSLVLFLSAFGPTPSQPQYFFAPLPFLVIVFLYALSDVTRKKLWPGIALVSMALILMIANKTPSKISADLAGLRHPEDWQPLQLHRFALKIQALVPQGKVLTLAPIIPLEAGLDTYEMFAVGPFSWRTANLLGKQMREEYRIISFKELDAFLVSDPPSAILVGVEANYEGFRPGDDGGLERPFIDYAVRSGFKPIVFLTDFAGIPTTLWVREDTPASDR